MKAWDRLVLWIKFAEKLNSLLFCRRRKRSKFQRNLKSELFHKKQKLRNKNKIYFSRKGLKFKDPERIRSELNGRQLQTKNLISFLIDTNKYTNPKIVKAPFSCRKLKLPKKIRSLFCREEVQSKNTRKRTIKRLLEKVCEKTVTSLFCRKWMRCIFLDNVKKICF